MYAIIEAGGKQFRVSEGDVIRCDVAGQAGEDVVFDRVPLAGRGTKPIVGTPTVEGAKVTGTVLRHGKGRKILVFKYKPKKRVRKLTGHRQPFAEVKITKIELP